MVFLKRTTNWSRPVIAYCRSKVLQNAEMEHSAILLTFIKLPFVIRYLFFLYFEWAFCTGFTVFVVQGFHGSKFVDKYRQILIERYGYGETVLDIHVVLICSRSLNGPHG